MVISKTRALAIKTQAVSPEFMILTSLKKFVFSLDKRKEDAKPQRLI
jgi:hypothetical protein